MEKLVPLNNTCCSQELCRWVCFGFIVIGFGFLLLLSGSPMRSGWANNQAERDFNDGTSFFFFSSSSPRDEVEEKHKSSSYHRHSYHLLQHDSQDASAEQRYKSAQPPLSPCMDSVQAAFVLLSPAGLHVWGECLCFVSWLTVCMQSSFCNVLVTSIDHNWPPDTVQFTVCRGGFGCASPKSMAKFCLITSVTLLREQFVNPVP